MPRPIALFVLSLFTAIPALAQNKAAPAKPAGVDGEVERKIVGGGKIPAGWAATGFRVSHNLSVDVSAAMRMQM